MRIFLILLLLIFGTIGFTQSNDFEGIIIFKRSAGVESFAIEKYFLKKDKMRIDQQFIVKNKYSEGKLIFHFDEYANYYFFVDSSGIAKGRVMSTSVESYQRDSTKKLMMLGYECEMAHVKYKKGDNIYFENPEVHQKRWVSNDLTYTIPKGWGIGYLMVSTFDNRIVLKLEETIEHSLQGLKPRKYSREAIAVYPMKLPDEIFDFKEQYKGE